MIYNREFPLQYHIFEFLEDLTALRKNILKTLKIIISSDNNLVLSTKKQMHKPGMGLAPFPTLGFEVSSWQIISLIFCYFLDFKLKLV